MLSAAKHFGVTHTTISNIFNTGKSQDNFTYKFYIKDIIVWVYDYKHKLINVLGNTLKTSTYYNIPYTTLARYIKSGKLYKNKYYFIISSLNQTLTLIKTINLYCYYIKISPTFYKYFCKYFFINDSIITYTLEKILSFFYLNKKIKKKNTDQSQVGQAPHLG